MRCVRPPARISPSRFTVNKVLMQGNKIIGEAAIRADAVSSPDPITPQNEIPEYVRASAAGEWRVFVQSESEVAAIHYGGRRQCRRRPCHDLFFQPGISLKQEGSSRWPPANFPPSSST